MYTIVSMLFLVSHVIGAQNDTSTTDSANPFVASNATEREATAGDVPLNVTEVGSANPFSPEGEDDRICCCQINNSTQYNAYQYQEFAPPECCCGSPGVDCPDVCGNTGFSSVCGSGQVCGVLLLMAALIGTLAVTICVTGVFLARRRRQRANVDQFFLAGGQAGQNGGAGGSLQRVNIVQIPDEQLKDLEIKDKDLDAVATGDSGDSGEAGVSGDPVDEERGEGREAEHTVQTECPICLEPIEHRVVSEFPCGHSCCRACRDDLVHHSSRVVNASTVAILCPLCRKLAVAPSPSGVSRRGSSRGQQIIVIQTISETPAVATEDPVEQRADAEADEEALARQDETAGSGVPITTTTTTNTTTNAV